MYSQKMVTKEKLWKRQVCKKKNIKTTFTSGPNLKVAVMPKQDKAVT